MPPLTARCSVGGSLQLTRISGIRIGVNVSWFLVLFLFIFWLQQPFGGPARQLRRRASWRRCSRRCCSSARSCCTSSATRSPRGASGIEVTGIELFFFGGVMQDEPRHRVARARSSASPSPGPLVTLAIVVVAASIARRRSSARERLLDAATLAAARPTLARLRLLASWSRSTSLLLVFNLIPAFPLDGGRIARAIAWKVTGDRNRATRFAARLGQVFAVAADRLRRCACWSRGGDAFGGLWLVVLGFILGQAARGAVVADRVHRAASRASRVADVMDAEPVTIPGRRCRSSRPTTSTSCATRLAVVRRSWRRTAASSASLHRAARRADAAAASRGAARSATVDARRRGRACRADAPLEALLGSEPLRRLGALMAVDADGRLRGVVTVEQVRRALAGAPRRPARLHRVQRPCPQHDVLDHRRRARRPARRPRGGRAPARSVAIISQGPPGPLALQRGRRAASTPR